MSQEKSLQHDVWEELKAVRNRGVGRLDEPKRPGLKEVPTPLLETAATAVPNYHPNLSRVATINLLLKREIASIQVPVYRHQLILSLGLRDDLDNTDPARLREQAAKFAKEESLNYGRTGGTEQTTLWILAGQIVADCFRPDQIKGSEQAGRPIASIATQLQAYEHQPFVERERYEQDFQQLLDQHHRRIIFNGGRGNGKSRLALELVSRRPSALEDGIFVTADSPEKLSNELRGILAARGKLCDDLFGAFSELICAPDAPSYVILDNLDDPTLLKDLLPNHSQSVIVVTANRKIPKYTHSSLEVTPMTQSEATGLVAKLLPSLSDEEHQRVAEALGYRPLAIVHACGYILGGGLVSVEEFLAELKKNAASTLEIPDVALADEPTLTAIYRFILTQLAQLRHAENPIRARELLELVACVASDDIPPGLIREVMGSPGETPSTTKFQEAVLALQTRFLVRVAENRLTIHLTLRRS